LRAAVPSIGPIGSAEPNESWSWLCSFEFVDDARRSRPTHEAGETMMDAWNRPPLSTVLNNIKRTNTVTATCTDGRGEWVLLKSRQSPDQLLFEKLKFSWPQLVPFADARRFALIFCSSGPNSGIWLHYLATPALCAEYLPGCHKIDSWI
jgi:hypothetical protein